jgi:hypothetical protein
MLITKHEGVVFQNQTVYISGQAFVRCSFISCTLILRETVYHLGSPESIREIKALVSLIEHAQRTQLAPAGTAMNAADRLPPQIVPDPVGAGT